MPRHLKRGLDASAIKAADPKVRETVESILADIDARKDDAVRELSRKFDNWSPASFRLTEQEVEQAIAQVPGATSMTSSSPRRRSATSRRSSARPCRTSRSRPCRASSSATAISR